uniref:ubiquitinyl hydrolase 1 n=1 Tax=Geospiza parvula TaxID=87175 RepID=A0A8U8BV38_GEOPR
LPAAPQASPSPGGLPGFGSGVPGVPYHERQRRQLCALHALNNLLQRPWLSQASADRICQREFLRAALAPAASELLLVVSRDVEEAGTWLSPE